MTEFERLVAKVMMNSHMGSLPEKPKLPPKKKRHKIVKRAEALSMEQAELLLLILEGKVATICIRGESYAYRRSDAGWFIRSLHDGEPEHTVFADLSACSCADCKFRGNICKHILALKEITNGL